MGLLTDIANSLSILATGMASKPLVKFEEGGEVDDLFEKYDELPQDVRDVLDRYSSQEQDYPLLENLLSELKPLGYTFEYGLDAIPFGLKKDNAASFLAEKGYGNAEAVYFKGDDNEEYLEAMQAQKGLKKIGVYYRIHDVEEPISKKMLDNISSSHRSGSEITLFTNAGVDLHSSSKGKYKNITVKRLPVQHEHGGSIAKEAIEHVSNRSGVRSDALLYFTEMHNLDVVKMAQDIGGNLKGIDLSTAISGNKGEDYIQSIVSQYGVIDKK